MRKVALIIIALLPFNAVRIFFYNLMGYKISYDSRIGMLNYLDFKQCTIVKSQIGNLNVFQCGTFSLGRNTRIGKLNKIKNLLAFTTGENVKVKSKNDFLASAGNSPYRKYESFAIGNNSTVTSGHVIECADTITLGDFVIVGGINSQFWTHGFTNDKVRIQGPITLGNHIYVGSSCMILPGITICDDVSLAAGTIGYIKCQQ